MAATELLKGRLNLFFFDCGILFILGTTGQSLPWKLAFKKVQNDVTNGLQIISSGLLNTFVSRNRCIPGRASQVFSVLVRNMFTFTVFVALGEAKIDNVHVIFGCLCAANQEVVRLNVSMDDSFFMDLFDALDHLNCNHENSLQVEAALTRLKKVLKRGAEQVHYHNVELLVRHRGICPDVVQTGHACYQKQLMSGKA